MKICNCHQDLDALLCDIPLEWREGIVKSLCAVYGELNQPTCDELRNCQTLTNLSPFTLIENNLSIKYKDEKGQIKTRSIDLTPILDSILDGVDPMCLTTPEDWASMSHTERMSLIYSEICTCCPPTTTTTTSTSTTSTTSTTTVAPDCVSVKITASSSSVVSYVDCNGDPQEEVFSVGVHYFCAYSGTIVIISGSPLIQIIDVCTGGTTSTSTTTTATPTTTTTTTSSSTTTTTTSGSTTTTTTLQYNAYFADQYECTGCTLFASGVQVALPVGHTVTVGEFYRPSIANGYSYQVTSDIPSPGPGLILSTIIYGDCGAACV